MGFGIETSSHKFGLFQHICVVGLTSSPSLTCKRVMKLYFLAERW